MGLNHDLKIMERSKSLSDLLRHLTENPDAAETYERHYAKILPLVLESQFPIRANESYARTQSVALSYMAFHDQKPSREILVDRASYLPQSLGINYYARRTTAPAIPRFSNSLDALWAVSRKSDLIESAIPISAVRDEERVSWRQHLWASHFMKRVRDQCFGGSEGDMRTELGIFAMKTHLGKLVLLDY